MDLPSMLAYTITSTFGPNGIPQISIGTGSINTVLRPSNPQNNSYWFCVIDAQNPTTLVREFSWSGLNNGTVPPLLDQYMSNKDCIISLVTQNLGAPSVPQGNFYNYLTSHGAGRELQRLEQLNATLGSGQLSAVSYVLTVQGRSTFGYEQGSDIERVRYAMSLMLPQGSLTYSLCDAYTF